MAKITTLCVASALLIAGCASNQRPAVEVSRAQSLIDQAQQGGAEQFAGADLEAARNKLQQADKKGVDHDQAKRWADEASIDAQVALARTQAVKAQQALAQVNAGSETLRQETTNQANQATTTQPIQPQPQQQER